MQTIGKTSSVCPNCLKVIPAKIIEQSGRVLIQKNCPEHGSFQALISSDIENYKFAKELYSQPQKKMVNNCPADCGLCFSHAQHTCLAVIEVTKDCDLHCGVCFASALGEQSGAEVDLETIREMFKAVLKSEGTVRPVQLSGGEPLTRNDLPEIVKAGKELGFDHIEINTNGIQLAKDPELARQLAEAGVSVIYLQFDGVNDDVYLKLRGEKLYEKKRDAIENCQKAGIAVTLVPTIVKGVNDEQLGDIIRFAMAHRNVTGVNFQPVTYLGRYPQAFSKNLSDRATIPDIIKGIVSQTNNLLKEDDFYPIPCPHPQCSALTLVMADENHIFPLTRLVNVKALVNSVDDPASVIPVAISKLWSMRPQDDVIKTLQKFLFVSNLARDDMQQPKLLTISMMAFQDCWTLDIERLQKCCIHVVTPHGKLVPFCAHYLTSIDGKRLPY
ncbi:MAG: radical SAM protein [Candidatus Bathyarchaeota archaeon]|nr:radical SAM protein [Candidatus Termiticorpusculum sp.]